MADPPSTSPAPMNRRWPGLALAVGLACLLVVLTIFRHTPQLLQSIYDFGNLLNTHTGSDLSEGAFDLALARVQLLLLTSIIAVLAMRVSTRAAFAAFGLSFAVIYFDSLTRYAATVAGRLYVFVCDDALISMRYARNFAEGRGLVYNLGEAVDGFTNPLWTALMVLPHAAKLPEGVTAIPVVVAGGALLVATALLVRDLLAAFEVPTPLQWLGTLAVTYDASSLEYAIAGLETPLVGFSVVLVVWGYFRKRMKALASGLVILTLTRADGMALAFILLGWMVLERHSTSKLGIVAEARASARWFLLVLGVGFALIGWRFAIYGHPLPNTYYLKVYPLAKRLAIGLASYGVRGLVMYGLPFAYVLLNGGQTDRTRTARRLMIGVASVWLYSIYVGGDVFIFMRFFGPVTPLLWLAVAIVAAADWESKASASAASTFAILALLVPVKSERGVIGATWDRHDWIEQSLSAAKTVERNVPSDASVATFYAGMPYYAPHHRFVDLLGKTESHIAHQSEIHGLIPGHNKFDFPYIYNVRKPDVTFAAMGCDDVERFTTLSAEERRARLDDLGRLDTVYQAPLFQAGDPTFMGLYLPNRVALRENGKGVGHPMGCWFVRTGSSVPVVWELARD